MSPDYPPFASPDPAPEPGAQQPGDSDATPPTNAPNAPAAPPSYPAYPNPAYPGYPGYPGAGAPAQPSGAYATPQAGDSAPNSTAPGAPYPPYPGYPPQGAYPPNVAYPSAPNAPYPPYAYPAAPSYPLYSPYAAAPYGAPAPGTYPGGPQFPQPTAPTPQPRKRNTLLFAILGGVAAIVIIAIVAVGLLALRNNGNGTVNTNATPTATLLPTATTQPTATAFPGSAVFSDGVPGVCGSQPQNWSTDTSGASVTCGGGAMTLTDPSTDKYLAAEYFQPPNYAFPSQYAASVTVTNMINACGGILVLGNQAEGYAGYLCTDGSWGVYSYDSNGNSQTVDSGYFGVGESYTLELALSPGKLDFSINGTPISTTQPTMTVSNFLALQVYSPNQGSNASAEFSNFVLTA